MKLLEAALIRALRTMAQVAVAGIPAGVMITDVDWKAIISIAICSGIASLLTSLAGLPEVKGEGNE